MSFIYTPFSLLLKGCLYISGNSYFFALFFFALAIQLILLPLAIKQHKSQIKMAQIKPKEMAIREKYKGRTDKVTQQKMTMEIQQMYQDNGYSQFSGCLPLLIQLPIIMILFTIVRQPISYANTGDTINIQENAKYAIEFYDDAIENLNKDAFENTEDYDNYVNQFKNYQIALGVTSEQLNDGYDASADELKITSAEAAEVALSRLILDGRDDFQALVDDGKMKPEIIAIYEETGLENYKEGLPNYHLGPLNLINEPDFENNLWLMLVPLFVFLSSFFSTKITRRFTVQQTDANGKPVGGGLFMEVGMPLISAIFAYSMSGAVGVYWIWRTLIGMAQSIIIAKVMPIPKVTEEMIEEAKKELKAKQKKKKVITIEVDEDDNSYDDMIVSGGSNSSRSSSESSDPARRTPRKIEMLTADDEDEVQENNSENNSDDKTE